MHRNIQEFNFQPLKITELLNSFIYSFHTDGIGSMVNLVVQKQIQIQLGYFHFPRLKLVFVGEYLKPLC